MDSNSKNIIKTACNILIKLNEQTRDKYIIDEEFIRNILDPKYQFTVTKSDKNQPEFSVIKNNRLLLAKPQITYQLDLKDIPKVFQRLKELKVGLIEDFLSIFKQDYIPFKLSEPNKITDKTILNFFREKNIAQTVDQASAKVKGFSYLFLYYWHVLFNENNSISREPGLKPYILVMSRIPFSEMYKKILNKSEKIEFVKIFDKILYTKSNRSFIKTNLRNYFDNDGNKLNGNNLNIAIWFHSIIDEEFESQEENGKYYKDVRHGNKHDLLSWPAGFITYSMGQYPVDPSVNMALVEIRGFTKKIDELESFLLKEFDWFAKT